MQTYTIFDRCRRRVFLEPPREASLAKRAPFTIGSLEAPSGSPFWRQALSLRTTVCLSISVYILGGGGLCSSDDVVGLMYLPYQHRSRRRPDVPTGRVYYKQQQQQREGCVLCAYAVEAHEHGIRRVGRFPGVDADLLFGNRFSIGIIYLLYLGLFFFFRRYKSIASDFAELERLQFGVGAMYSFEKCHIIMFVLSHALASCCSFFWVSWALGSMPRSTASEMTLKALVHDMHTTY